MTATISPAFLRGNALVNAAPAGLLVALLLTGCASQPEATADRAAGVAAGVSDLEGFSAVQGLAMASPTSDDLRWWRRFDDPELSAWVERALAANLDIALAVERVEQARALLKLARAERSPRLVAQGDVELRLYDRSSGAGRAGGDRRLQPGVALALDVDPDLFGGLRAAERAASAGVLRAQDLAHAARLAAAGLAARSYLEWQLALADHALLGENVALLRDALRVADVRVDAGLSPVLDRERARAELANTEAALAQAAVRIGQAAAALQLVAGQVPRPGPLVTASPVTAPAAARLAQAPEAGPVARAPLPPLAAVKGLQPVTRPLDLLRLRPDLRAAEQALVAAAADVGVAQAALLPRLALPGSIVFGATSGGAVLGLAGATLSALLEATLFDGGARSARIDEAQSRAREAEIAWRQSLLLAVRQVEDALLAHQGAQARIEAASRGSSAARAAQAQAQVLYRAGLTNYLDVVDAQRTALASDRLLLQARADSAAAAVRAFEAMGLIDS